MRVPPVDRALAGSQGAVQLSVADDAPAPAVHEATVAGGGMPDTLSEWT